MSSFKLQKAQGSKAEAKSIGALFIVIGVFAGIVVHPWALIMIPMGLILLVAAHGASE